MMENTLLHEDFDKSKVLSGKPEADKFADIWNGATSGWLQTTVFGRVS
jgi:hypothetical protein